VKNRSKSVSKSPHHSVLVSNKFLEFLHQLVLLLHFFELLGLEDLVVLQFRLQSLDLTQFLLHRLDLGLVPGLGSFLLLGGGVEEDL